MTTASTHAAKFYEDVVLNGTVYTVDDGEGYSVFPVNGIEVVPFWSARSRVIAVQKAHPKYSAWSISEESLTEFLDKTLTMLEEAGVHVGVNWTGAKLTGYDLSVQDLRRNLQYWIDKNAKGKQQHATDS